MTTYAREWEVPSSSDPNKTYTVKEDSAGKLSCNCPSWIYSKGGKGIRTCKHTQYMKSKADQTGGVSKLKKPKTYNGFKLGDTVTYVSEFESEEGDEEGDSLMASLVGKPGKIMEFQPSPKYNWVARVEFRYGSPSGDQLRIWDIPMIDQYLEKIGKVKVEVLKDQEELRGDLYTALMG